MLFKQSYKNHEILSFDDEEELKKENIIIEDSSEHFKENKNKIEESKNKIEMK